MHREVAQKNEDSQVELVQSTATNSSIVTMVSDYWVIPENTKNTKQKTQTHKFVSERHRKHKFLVVHPPLDNQEFVTDTNTDGILLWGQ